ncbi:MAG TPA: STAS domain-containing protein [Leptolyngbyaceae cyanobacterium M33_DOE_097]|uniref:Anti-sigma factor antagonist n=1 Tax=Oscillatoriales cyanobacterium SpSt-418 TaxID=2282169 RepID=A0A7C3PID9_9CYAN|nr:STAS domain-containing protein [Leptolyngbyaceae cyanobacterium M33_DOE_097]
MTISGASTYSLQPIPLKVFKPTTSFTAANARTMLNEFKACMEAGVQFMLVDLRDVQFMDSFGLGVLVSMHTKLKMAHGRLGICNLHPSITTLFNLSDMHNLFQIVRDRAEFELALLDRRSSL